MADFTVSGLSEQMEELLRLGQVPDEVKAEILTAGGTVLKEEQAKVAREMGIYDRDNDSKHAVDSIGLTKVKLNEDGGKISVTFKGKRTDKNHKKPIRNAEIMFINHYGKRGQDPRPFATVANARAEERLQETTQATFDRWYNKN